MKCEPLLLFTFLFVVDCKILVYSYSVAYFWLSLKICN